MSDMKCPFCKEELSYVQEIDGGFEILTCDCPHGIWLFGNDKMWYNLEKAITKLEHTRKALEIAVKKAEALKELADIAGFGMFSAGCQDIIDQINQMTILFTKENNNG